MSGPDQDESKRASGLPRDGRGVLANLPRTRPQHASARRATARKTTGARASARDSSDALRTSAAEQRSRAGSEQATSDAPKARGRSAPKQRSSRAPKQRATNASKRPMGTKAAHEPVPRQGYECPAESTSGSVQPPGGTELVASAAELIGELAKAGVSTGERLLKDVLGRLPIP